jgi:hypothetical protein
VEGTAACEGETFLAGLECEGNKTVLVFLVDERTGSTGVEGGGEDVFFPRAARGTCWSVA